MNTQIENDYQKFFRECRERILGISGKKKTQKNFIKRRINSDLLTEFEKYEFEQSVIVRDFYQYFFYKKEFNQLYTYNQYILKQQNQTQNISLCSPLTCNQIHLEIFIQILYMQVQQADKYEYFSKRREFTNKVIQHNLLNINKTLYEQIKKYQKLLPNHIYLQYMEDTQILEHKNEFFVTENYIYQMFGLKKKEYTKRNNTIRSICLIGNHKDNDKRSKLQFYDLYKDEYGITRYIYHPFYLKIFYNMSDLYNFLKFKWTSYQNFLNDKKLQQYRESHYKGNKKTLHEKKTLINHHLKVLPEGLKITIF